MKKQILSEEFKRMQKIAGIINENESAAPLPPEKWTSLGQDFEFEEEDFETIDEDTLISYLNEYYIVNPDRLPKSELF